MASGSGDSKQCTAVAKVLSVPSTNSTQKRGLMPPTCRRDSGVICAYHHVPTFHSLLSLVHSISTLRSYTRGNAWELIPSWQTTRDICFTQTLAWLCAIRACWRDRAEHMHAGVERITSLSSEVKIYLTHGGTDSGCTL